jgi:hypothetical protein
VDLETTLAYPGDENLTILTEFSTLQLLNVVRFASKGVLPSFDENETILHNEFLSFGIDLSRFNLVPENDRSGLDWPEDDCIDTKPFLLPIVIKTEDIVISENEFDENVKLILKKKRKTKVKVKKQETEFKEKVSVDSDCEASPNVQFDQVEDGSDQLDPDFELENESLRPKRKYNKRKKSGEETEEAREQKKIRLK